MTAWRNKLIILVVIAHAFCRESFAANEWTLRLIDDTGFGDPSNTGIVRMTTHSNYLYVGTWNPNGCKIYRSTDGQTWNVISTAGFGTPGNFCVLSLQWFNGRLYVTTWNYSGLWVLRGNADAADPGNVTWETITTNGFGDPHNWGGTSAQVFNGYLYVGCFNPTTGPEVWRSVSGDAGSWTQVNRDGWGFSGNTDATMMLAYEGYLYVGTEGLTQLWRTDGNLSPPYDQWKQVNQTRFGNPANHNICGLGVLNGKIYAGTWNSTQGLEVWRAPIAASVPFAGWEKVNANGFGDPTLGFALDITVLGNTLYLGTAHGWNPDGGTLMKTTDGTNWEQIYISGFLEPPSAGACWLEVFRGRLFIGGWSGMSGTKPSELWVDEPPPAVGVPAAGPLALIATVAACLLAFTILLRRKSRG
jgi:hypothetical protein